MNSRKMPWLIALAFVASLGAASAFAETKSQEWKENHPRRAQVNKRLKKQNKRIKEGVKDGKLTKEQAQQLHQEDKAIRQEERADAAKHHGHITKAEQRQLNKEENKASKDIYKEKHGEPAAGTPAAPPAASGQ